jgi:hypothetical protein
VARGPIELCEYGFPRRTGYQQIVKKSKPSSVRLALQDFPIGLPQKFLWILNAHQRVWGHVRDLRCVALEQPLILPIQSVNAKTGLLHLRSERQLREAREVKITRVALRPIAALDEHFVSDQVIVFRGIHELHECLKIRNPDFNGAA